MKKFMQEVRFQSYLVKIQNIKAENENILTKAMKIGCLRQEIANKTFLGKLTMEQWKALKEKMDEA